MNTTSPTDLANHLGPIYVRGEKPMRSSTATVELSGVSIDCVYVQEGAYEPATATDPACLPCAVILSMAINGVDVTRLLLDTAVGERCCELIEEEWK